MTAPVDPADRLAESVLIYHQPMNDRSCVCGWAELGRSHPAHQVAKLREAGVLICFCPTSEQHDGRS